MAKEKDFNQDFSGRLNQLMLDNSVTIVELSKALDISRQSISNYLKCESIPNIVVCKDIANYFNVSTDYLIGKDLQPQRSDEDLYNELGLTSKTLEKLRILKKEAYNQENSSYLMYILNVLIQVEDIEYENGLLNELKDYVLYSYKNDTYLLDKEKVYNLSISDKSKSSSFFRNKINGEDIETLKLLKLQNSIFKFKTLYLEDFLENEEMEIFHYTNKPNMDGFYLVQDDTKQLFYKDGEYYYQTEDGYLKYNDKKE